MSMWEIEALIEDAVQLISTSEKKPIHKRSIIWNLYEIQGQFDCSFTNFRVMKLLLKTGYTKTMPIEEHPDFSKSTIYFEALKTKDFEFINTKPAEKWSADNPVAAYWDKKTHFIYYDLGTPLWELLEAETPQEFDLYDLGFEIIKEAHEQNHKKGVYNWTAFLINYGLNYFEQTESLAVLKERYFKTIKRIFKTYDFSDYTVLHRSLEVMKAAEDWMGEEERKFVVWFNS
ncbi:MAG: Unknown protein [uncultured Aureispira sp.]|uniref:Uncharacterized protein n=1 Tax=uncultured Aureispira sp. TaxID=1331704 RepID=A0A6S6T044_9BACT|nr:MAG: Unknown protein [uncultured Aureispira sp.]